jgi:hypothetical protein
MSFSQHFSRWPRRSTRKQDFSFPRSSGLPNQESLSNSLRRRELNYRVDVSSKPLYRGSRFSRLSRDHKRAVNTPNSAAAVFELAQCIVRDNSRYSNVITGEHLPRRMVT